MKALFITSIEYLVLVVFIALLLGCTEKAWVIKSYQSPDDNYTDYRKGSVFKDTIQRDNIK